MIIYLEIIFFSVFCYELVRFFKLREYLYNSYTIYIKIFKLFSLKKASDHFKQKVLLKYSFILFLSSGRILILFIVIFLMYYIIHIIDSDFKNHLLSLSGIIEITIFLLIYNKIKKKFNAKL